MSFVLDSAVFRGGLLETRAPPYVQAIAERLAQDGAVAPALLRRECASVLRAACRRGRMTAWQAQAVISQLEALPAEYDTQAPDARLLLALALRCEVSSCDVARTDLALHRQLPIATRDVELAEAARICGVGVVNA